MEQIGNVQIYDMRRKLDDILERGTLLDEMLEIAQDYTKEQYNQVIYERKSAEILYQFSPVRENIISWLPIAKTDSVLEIGAECGALTGALAEKARCVDSVEVSMKKSQINAYRHKDMDNVAIYVGEFKDVENALEKKYDYIVLIGHFAYAANYIDSGNPHEEILKNIRKYLAPRGKIVVAIENKFGLKYWAGCREEHTGNFFEGLEGYWNNTRVRTFGKNELTDLIKRAGFDDISFYYPYPDYKLPEKIFSDEYLPQMNELTANYRNFDENRMELFNETKVYNEILKEGLFQELSNSFLVLIQGA